MFFSYSIRNYNARTSEIWTKDNMLKEFLVTVDGGWGGGGGCGVEGGWVRMSSVENFLKINKSEGVY